jgi:hypothetical protein
MQCERHVFLGEAYGARDASSLLSRILENIVQLHIHPKRFMGKLNLQSVASVVRDNCSLILLCKGKHL